MDVHGQGGSFTQRPEDCCFVSYWHIPGGADYEHAEVRQAFFADRAVAEKLAAQHEMPPTMAVVIDLKQGTEHEV